MCRREVARLWERRAMVCGAGQKAACGMETGVGHKRRKEQQQGGRENQKKGGRRLRKWGAAAGFQEAAGTHLDTLEHGALLDLGRSPKVPSSRTPSQGICRDREGLKMVPACKH